MDDLTGFHMFNRVHKCREDQTVMFHPVSRHMDNDDSERQLLEVVLMFKALIDCHQNVTLPLGLRDQLGIRERPPFGFRNGQDFMIGEGLPETGVNALV